MSTPTAAEVSISQTGFSLPLTEADLDALEDMLLGTGAVEGRDRFEQVYGSEISLKLFIRQLVGLDRNAAKAAFATYLQAGTFSADQIRFVSVLIDNLTQKGIIDPSLLYESPFTDIHTEGLDGIFADTDAPTPSSPSSAPSTPPLHPNTASASAFNKNSQLQILLH